MSRASELCEIVPGLLIGNVTDAAEMVRRNVDTLVPLAFLDGNIWRTGFRGEILYYPVTDMDVLPEDVLHDLVEKICSRLEAGKKVGMFCAGGHGRTGYVAACILARLGIKNPIGYLHRNYSPKAVESDRQANAVFVYTRWLLAKQADDAEKAEGEISGLLGEHFFEYEPYEGDDPYIYLSFSEWDGNIAPDMVRALCELGFHVSYDRDVLSGRLWSAMRSEAIERCSLFMYIHTPCEKYSHILYTDTSFAELLEKPTVYVEMDEEEYKYYDQDDEEVAGKPSDSDFAGKCLRALAKKGMVPGMKRPEDDAKERPGRRDLHDLIVIYYEHYGDQKGPFNRRRQRRCNLRTRETYDSSHNKLEKPSDEELYRAIGWKLAGYEIWKRSPKCNYVPMKEDCEFMRRLRGLAGKPVPEIDREYRERQKAMDDYWRDYPYMDEFEYIDSLFDDD